MGGYSKGDVKRSMYSHSSGREHCQRALKMCCRRPLRVCLRPAPPRTKWAKDLWVDHSKTHISGSGRQKYGVGGLPLSCDRVYFIIWKLQTGLSTASPSAGRDFKGFPRLGDRS